MNSIRSIITVFLLLLFSPDRMAAQGLGQAVRGTVLDADTRQPVPGTAIAVVGIDPPMSTVADDQGRFTIVDVPVGRVSLRVRAIGYEEAALENLLLTSAKELVLNIMLSGAVTEMAAVTVTGERPRGKVRNDMAVLSARTIGVEETSRIAGSINDPARMVSAFPGVAGDPLGDNSIVVRGNSPTGVLWRLEGMEIPNPNHFSDDGATGGSINVLNSDMLDNSEFYTGAFAPEYGNALSAVYDMHLREGNDSKREYTLKLGVLGTDLTAEGPLPGVTGGSYLVNYRYSSLSLLDQAGIVNFGGVPIYTDGAFKVKMPIAGAGTFTLFGLGGKSRFLDEDEGVTGDTLFSRSHSGSRMGVLGLEHTRTLGSYGYVHSSISINGNGSSTDYDELPELSSTALEHRHEDEMRHWTTRLATTFNTKLNAKNKLRTGVIVSLDNFRLGSSSWNIERQRMETQLDAHGDAATVQAFASWKWHWNERWSMTSGVHVLHFGLNRETSMEPRLGLRFQQRPDQAFTFAAGLHAREEALMTYLVQRTDGEGKVTRLNTGLAMTKALHVVAGYDRMLKEDLRLTAEVYWQHLYDVPVENDPHSAFSLLNQSEWFTDRPLVNEGLGRNMGIEACLEKYFTHGWHFLTTFSYVDARYKALDGVWRNSRFNLGPVANALAGKEWKLGPEGKDRVLTTGMRYTVMGGRYTTPIDLPTSMVAGEQKESDDAWSLKDAPVHKVDVVVSYRVGRPKTSHEFKLDMQNVLNASTTVYRYYERRTETIREVPQLAFLPVVQYTLRF